MKISICSERPILEACDLEDFEHQVDPYVGCAHDCLYCYVLDRAETDWAAEVQIHGDLVGRLDEALDGLPPQTIYLGCHTDPYQPCEADELQTRRVLALLLSRGFSASVLTKSDLVLRDLDLLRRMPAARVGVSVAFTDERVRGLFEGNTLSTARRLAALAEARATGLRTSALVCPVIPRLSDTVALVEAAARSAGTVWVYRLNAEADAPGWRNVRNVLELAFPEIREEVEAIVLDPGHAYWAELREELAEVAERTGAEVRVYV